MAKHETPVLIVGAGPSGLAIAACLSDVSIPYVILEREDCHSSLWRKRTYDRLHLHLAKEFCGLPFKPHDSTAPTYIPKNEFIKYLDDYVAKFNINPHYNRFVYSVSYDRVERKWKTEARDMISNNIEVYLSKFLVIASGDNDEGYIPKIPGIEKFNGEVVHSNAYKSGLRYHARDVLVVGCGNSGMEIAYDLSNYGANTSLVIRNPFHVTTRGIIRLGMTLLQYLPVSMVDPMVQLISRIWYGDLSNYGIRTPKLGPFHSKAAYGRSPVIDVGTIDRIKAGIIKVEFMINKVVPGISKIKSKRVVFDNGLEENFDAIIFATGYKVMTRQWLKDNEFIFKENGTPKNMFSNHWKGDNGSYCVGFSKMGLFGIAKDAQDIANDIAGILNVKNLSDISYIKS
ncbi:hypothetical protein V2J09_021892 [Rumex salicifolius]